MASSARAATQKRYADKNKEKLKGKVIEWQKRNPKSVLLHQAKTRAKRNGVPFSITVNDFEIPDVCPALGIPVFKGDGVMHDGSPSLDRKDNALGYVPGNVYVVSWRANNLKKDATADELRAIADWMED